MRPLISASGIPSACAPASVLGQISESTKSPISGRQCSRKRATDAGVSTGALVKRACGKPRCHEAGRRHRHAGHQDGAVRRFEQFVDQREHRRAFAEACTMDPDEFAPGPQQRRMAKSFGHARAILLAAQCALSQCDRGDQFECGRGGAIGTQGQWRRGHRLSFPRRRAGHRPGRHRDCADRGVRKVPCEKQARHASPFRRHARGRTHRCGPHRVPSKAGAR